MDAPVSGGVPRAKDGTLAIMIGGEASAIAAVKPIWHHASASFGCLTLRPSIEPTLLPMPSPNRNTARMSENVYVVAPKSNERSRVQMTSAASAVKPDNAMTRYTPNAPAARVSIAVAGEIEAVVTRCTGATTCEVHLDSPEPLETDVAP